MQLVNLIVFAGGQEYPQLKMMFELLIGMGLFLLFVIIGILVNWTLALIVIVLLMFFGLISYYFLTKKEKKKLIKLRENYDERENESGTERPTNFGRTFERGKHTSTIESFSKRPRASEYGSHQPSGEVAGGHGEIDSGDKPSGFTPV